MTPRDPRHGSPAGYVAGCREECCRAPRRRAHKESTLRRLEGAKPYVDETDVLPILDRWEAMGIGRRGIAIAAGLGMHTPFGHDRQRITTATYRAFAAVTEDDFTEATQVYADLTRTRVYSLMAAGHSLTSIPVPAAGRWRTATRIRVDVARAVRDHYAAVHETNGTNLNAAAKGRRAGGRLPIEWDDPGTLAWPLNAYCDLAHVDEVVVERLLALKPTPESRRPEREEAMSRWLAQGRSATSLNNAHGWAHGRYARDSDQDQEAS